MSTSTRGVWRACTSWGLTGLAEDRYGGNRQCAVQHRPTKRRPRYALARNTGVTAITKEPRPPSGPLPFQADPYHSRDRGDGSCGQCLLPCWRRPLLEQFSSCIARDRKEDAVDPDAAAGLAHDHGHGCAELVIPSHVFAGARYHTLADLKHRISVVAAIHEKLSSAHIDASHYALHRVPKSAAKRASLADFRVRSRVRALARVPCAARREAGSNPRMGLEWGTDHPRRKVVEKVP